MTVLDILYTLFIGPLELFFDVFFSVSYGLTENPGIAIILLSLAMNVLVLPLYRRADVLQEEERLRTQKSKPVLDHIRKTFSGDERFMMQQAYNRERGYKPTDALRGSVSLLLEIPFFIAAFHFLSNLPLLQGVSFGPIADLGAPDALIQIGAVSINLLPILMTAINLLSAAIYMKGMPLSNKVQMVGIAAIFLVLLYNSPAGLVFYWTLNNIFSLVKNIVYRLKKPRATEKKRKSIIPETTAANTRVYVLSGLFLAILTGAVIPASVIQASPAEFVNIADYVSPLWYVVRSFTLAVGLFVLWFNVFYWLASPRGRTILGCIMFAACGIAIVDYLFFGLDLGTLSPNLQYQSLPEFSMRALLLNAGVVVGVAAVFVLIWLKGKALAQIVGVSICAAALVMAGMSVANINEALEALKASRATVVNEELPHATLSREGKNVVVIMMDREISYFLPYILHEKPELKESIQGFTYYPNTISFGNVTNVASPAMYGGYDYTPERLNERDNELLVDKQNEALKVMPRIFSEHGFKTTFLDPTYAGYSWIPDLSVFNDLPEVKTYYTLDGSFPYDVDDNGEAANDQARLQHQANQRNFFCYAVMKTVPLVLQPLVYHRGDYRASSALRPSGLGGPKNPESQEEHRYPPELYVEQVRENSSVSIGVDRRFVTPYGVLRQFPNIFPVVDGDENTFTIITNDTAHEPTVLKEPEFVPAMEVDNREYDADHVVRKTDSGESLDFPLEPVVEFGYSRVLHYEVNMAAIIGLCDWFDYLREQGVYDNTRIILVSDHSTQLMLRPELLMKVDDTGETPPQDPLVFNCMFMVKDFDSNDFMVNNEFMTNADMPTQAMVGLIDNPVNPYTGNAIVSSTKYEIPLHLTITKFVDILENNGTTFLPSYWFDFHGDNVFDRGNWSYLGYY